MQKLAMDIFLLISQLCSFLFSSPQPKDTLLRLMALTQVFALLYGLKRGSNKVPIQHAYLSLYMPLSVQLRLLSVHHQPSASTLYNLLLPRTYCLPQCNHQCSGNQMQQLQILTNSTYIPLKNGTRKKKNMPYHLFESPFHPTFQHLIFHTSIQ